MIINEPVAIGRMAVGWVTTVGGIAVGGGTVGKAVGGGAVGGTAVGATCCVDVGRMTTVEVGGIFVGVFVSEASTVSITTVAARIGGAVGDGLIIAVAGIEVGEMVGWSVDVERILIVAVAGTVSTTAIILLRLFSTAADSISSPAFTCRTVAVGSGRKGLATADKSTVPEIQAKNTMPIVNPKNMDLPRHP